LGRQVLVIRLVDLHHRRRAAGGQALGGAQRDLAVLRGFAHVHAEALLAVLDQIFGAAQGARQRVANPDLMLARLLLVEQRVEGDDALHVRRR
jgi:hypothetical protein